MGSFCSMKTVKENASLQLTSTIFNTTFLEIKLFCFYIDFYGKENAETQITVRQTLDKFWTIIRQSVLRETVIYFVQFLSTL